MGEYAPLKDSVDLLLNGNIFRYKFSICRMIMFKLICYRKQLETFANLVIAQNVKYLKRGKMVPTGVSWGLKA